MQNKGKFKIATAITSATILAIFGIFLTAVIQPSALMASSAAAQIQVPGKTAYGNDTVNNNMTGADSLQTATSSLQLTNTSSSIGSAREMMSANKTFYLFNQEVEGLNETEAGIPADIFSIPVIVVNKGDNITINFYNTEESGEDPHSFVMSAPYNIDQTVQPGQNITISFTADHEGVFLYYCKYHSPTMRGQLVVLPSTLTSSASADMSMFGNSTASSSSTPNWNSHVKMNDTSSKTTFEEEATKGTP
jgi:plastocyanin